MNSQDNTSPSRAVVLHDPTIHLYAYYLARAAGDSFQEKQDRHAAFESEVWRALAALGCPDKPALSLDKAVARDTRVELYRTGFFPLHEGGGWLFAYSLNDSYLLRLTVYRDGARSLQDLAALADDLGWEATPYLSNYLGTSAYYCATLSLSQSQAIAQQLLGEKSLWRERTPWGALYGIPSPAGPFALFYSHAGAERAADDFFDRVVPEMEWYIHKVQAQARQYEMGLHPILEAMKDALRAEGQAARHLYTRLSDGQAGTARRFSALLDRLEGQIMDYTARIKETTVTLYGLRINEQNFCHLLTREGFDHRGNGLLARRVEFLSRASRQTQSDLAFYRLQDRQMTDLLARLRAVQARLAIPAGETGNRLSRPHLFGDVSNPDLVIQHPGIALEKEEKALLKQLFAPYTHLSLLTQLAGGLSGGRILLALPRRPDDFDAYTIVKLGAADAILREFNSYQTFVADKLPLLTARIQHPPVVQELRGALRYTFVGGLGDDRPLQSLGTYARRQPADTVARLIEGLFETFGQYWWQVRNPKPFWLWKEYDRWLPPHATVKLAPEGTEPVRILAADSPADPSLPPGQCLQLEGFTVDEVDGIRERLLLVGQEATGGPGWRLHLKVPRSQAAGYTANQQLDPLKVMVHANRRGELLQNAQRAFPDFQASDPRLPLKEACLPNPLSLLSQVLEQHVLGTSSVIHGDLNLGNILVGPGNFAWLIDFAWTRRGHTLLDFAWLEVHLVTHILAERFGEPGPRSDPTVLLPVLDWLETGDLERPFPFEHRSQQKAATMLAAVRRIVRQCLFSQKHPQEHRWPLALCYLSALRFRFPDEVNGRSLSKQLALVAAAHLLGRWPVK